MSFFKSSMRNLPARADEYELLKYFDDVFNGRRAAKELDASLSSFAPMINIQESVEGYHVEAELPGVNKEDIEVNVKDDHLIIKGEKKSYNEERKEQYHRIERSHGSFYRAIALPSDIDKDKINAELKDGILKVDVMKSSAPMNSEKKIAIR